MNERARTWLLIGLAVLLGVGVGVGAVVLTDRGGSNAVDQTSLKDPSATGLPPDHVANSIAFLNAWDRFRNGTFVVDLRFERTVTGKTEPLVSAGILVQKPPRRVVRAFGNESSLFADGAQTCDLGAESTSVCTAQQKTEPYDVQVAEELSVLSQYFSGDTPLYRVEAPSPGCFRLHLYRAMQLPPYGDAAQFCFDAATGAMTLFETSSESGSDRTTALQISTTVTDADFNRT